MDKAIFQLLCSSISLEIGMDLRDDTNEVVMKKRLWLMQEIKATKEALSDPDVESVS